MRNDQVVDALYRDYIHARLNRTGIGWYKPEHQLSASDGMLGHVSSVLMWLVDELEYLRPNIYSNVARQLNITVESESVLSDAFLAVAAEIFSTGITWGKVVSLYAVAGALAVDCASQLKDIFLFTMTAYPDSIGPIVRRPMGLPITVGCDTALIRTRVYVVCYGFLRVKESLTKMQHV
uniref:BCL2 family apoptosis regulator BOK n=1 Tax=Oncorhynchus kisutch TaxID=8019 RepID=A0A8C7K8K3_ONCKI